jgi:hypothetical protein
MLNINAKESKALIRQMSAVKTAAVIDRFNRAAQMTVAAQASATGEKLAAEHINNVTGTNLPGALAVALMMSKVSSAEEGPVIAANAEKLADGMLPGVSAYMKSHHLPGMKGKHMPGGKDIEEYLDTHHMPGKEDVAEYLESHHLPGMQGKHLPGMEGAGGALAEYIRTHHMPGASDVSSLISAHPLASAGTAVGAGAGAAGLAALLANR